MDCLADAGMHVDVMRLIDGLFDLCMLMWRSVDGLFD